VSATVASLPKVAIWEIDPYSAPTAPAGSVAPADPATSLAGALAAAAAARAPGQLLGVGLPATGSSWWAQMATAVSPRVRAVLNFAGVDTAGLGGASGLQPAGLRWVLTLVRQDELAQAGLPGQMPLFVVAGPGSPESVQAQADQAQRDAAALAGLGVGLLAWSSPQTAGGQLGAGTGGLLAALVRPAAP
jgi:hypothetical protein